MVAWRWREVPPTIHSTCLLLLSAHWLLIQTLLWFCILFPPKGSHEITWAPWQGFVLKLGPVRCLHPVCLLSLCSPGSLRFFFPWIIFMNYGACTFFWRVFEHPSFPVLIEQKLERRHKCTDMQVIKRNPKRHTHTHMSTAVSSQKLTQTSRTENIFKTSSGWSRIRIMAIYTLSRWNCPPKEISDCTHRGLNIENMNMCDTWFQNMGQLKDLKM